MEGRVRKPRDVASVGLRAFGVVLLALVLSSCSESSVVGDASDGNATPGGMKRGGGVEFASSDGEMMPSSGGQAAGRIATQASASAQPATAQTLPDDFDRKIVKTAELGIRAEDVCESAAGAQQVAAGYGGSVLSSQVSRSDDSVHADLTLSVPSADFEVALDDLRGLGKKVTTDAIRGEDVTEEFVDLESRERNLLAAEQSLLKLYDRAKNVEDTLTVQRELTSVRAEIELVQGRLKYLEERASFSRITLEIEPVQGPKPPPPAWSPTRVADQAWDASLIVLQGFATALISAFVFGWWLAPALVLGLLWWRRRYRGQEGGPETPQTD